MCLRIVLLLGFQVCLVEGAAAAPSQCAIILSGRTVTDIASGTYGVRLSAQIVKCAKTDNQQKPQATDQLNVVGVEHRTRGGGNGWVAISQSHYVITEPTGVPLCSSSRGRTSQPLELNFVVDKTVADALPLDNEIRLRVDRVCRDPILGVKSQTWILYGISAAAVRK